MDVVAEASNGKELVDLVKQYHPDVTLVDLRMPQLSGLEAIQSIKKDWSSARIVVLTTFDGDEDIYRALQAGAQAYLLKDTPRNELLETIRLVYKGHKRIPPQIATKLADRIISSELTERETDVLREIVNGFSNKEIGIRLNITEGTVKAHVNNILNKLGVNDRTQAVTTAIKRGIVHLD